MAVVTAAGLVPSGLMYMTMTSLGSYGQCLSTRVYEDSENRTSPTLFMGQYCGLHVLPNPEVYETLIEYIEQLGDVQVYMVSRSRHFSNDKVFRKSHE